jgi:hypothetical protein
MALGAKRKAVDHKHQHELDVWEDAGPEKDDGGERRRTFLVKLCLERHYD